MRRVCKEDYFKQHLHLLSQLSKIDIELVSNEQYCNFISKLNDTHNIIVVEKDGKLIGTATYFIEDKLIHNFGKVGHIEDVVVHSSERGSGLGKEMIQYLIDYCEKLGCYKTILHCNAQNSAFYEKCGMNNNGCCMAKYIEKI
jgi:glucosamine-phosphate N-acetyltransferase